MTRSIPPLLAASLLVTLGPLGCGDNDDDTNASEDTATYEVLTETTIGEYTVSWTSDPSPLPFNDYFSVTVTVLDAAQAPVSGLNVGVDAQMPAHGHGMTVAPELTDNGDGTYTADPLLFAMEGYWQILVDVEGEEGAFNYTCCEG